MNNNQFRLFFGHPTTVSIAEAKLLQKAIHSKARQDVKAAQHILQCVRCQCFVDSGDFALQKCVSRAGAAVYVPRLCCQSCSKTLSQVSVMKKATRDEATLTERYHQFCASSGAALEDNSGTFGALHDKKAASQRRSRTSRSKSRFSQGRAGSAASSKSTNAATDYGKMRSDRISLDPRMLVSSQLHPAFQDAFLVVTQMVKTSAADQAGLCVGDCFLRFGHLHKENFNSLRQVADLVRKSPNKVIHVQVLRQTPGVPEATVSGGVDVCASSNSGSSKMKKNELNDVQLREFEVTPLSSLDINGGGVLGAVVNTWPLPRPLGHLMPADANEFAA